MYLKRQHITNGIRRLVHKFQLIPRRILLLQDRLHHLARCPMAACPPHDSGRSPAQFDSISEICSSQCRNRRPAAPIRYSASAEGMTGSDGSPVYTVSVVPIYVWLPRGIAKIIRPHESQLLDRSACRLVHHKQRDPSRLSHLNDGSHEQQQADRHDDHAADQAVDRQMSFIIFLRCGQQPV